MPTPPAARAIQRRLRSFPASETFDDVQLGRADLSAGARLASQLGVVRAQRPKVVPTGRRSFTGQEVGAQQRDVPVARRHGGERPAIL